MSVSQLEVLPKTEQRMFQDSQPRCDRQTEQAVDQGILLQESVGTGCAIEYLQANNVPPHVTRRVLTGTLRRGA